MLPLKLKKEAKLIIYPIQTCLVCKDIRNMITTNDGNRTQTCISCDWTWSLSCEQDKQKQEDKLIIYPIQTCPICKDIRNMITTNDGNRTQTCISCDWSWTWEQA